MRAAGPVTGVRSARLGMACVAALVLTNLGCQSTHWLRARRLPQTPLAESLNLFSWSGPEPTPRTLQWLRRNDLTDTNEDKAPQRLVEQVNDIAQKRRTSESVYALAELAFLAGKQAEDQKDPATAFDMYGISVANAYLYLVDKNFDQRRNPYDPQFRLACDLYNGALESAMRLAQRQGPLTPGTTRYIQTPNQSIELSVVSKGSWRPEQIERIEFASDYEAKGLKNNYRSYGLGVPLIAVFRRDGNTPEEQFYAPGMSVAATAFLRVLPDRARSSDESCHFCTLELHDPLVASDVEIVDRLVPLETDLSTPLAYSLSDPMFQRTDIGTRGLLNPDTSKSVQGIYMLEPYDPEKIPVLMVHGLWSSLITWMEMFNDLRGNEEIRNHYQFWFYLYPTGQPFWISSAQLRQDLERIRLVLDPDNRAPALDEMVLVGHSMGGLLSRMQTLESGDDFWGLVSNKPFQQLHAPRELKDELRETWFFRPDRSIRRVVTIATPHRGSEFSNSTTQWLARKLIRFPEAIAAGTQRLFAENAELRNSPLLNVKNSVESLSPDSPVLAQMLRAPRAPWVNYHNIVGSIPEEGVIGRVAAGGDGVVKLDSARISGVASETTVPEDHIKIHVHPRSVLEVQRILIEHLEVLRTAAGANALTR